VGQVSLGGVQDRLNNLDTRLDHIERHIVKAAGNLKYATTAKPSNGEAYCVIGDKSSSNRAIHRVWKLTAEEAIQHAATLMQGNPYSNKPTDKLFVVKIVSVVHRKQPETQVDVRPLDCDTQMSLFN
jgi:hypothetical protein